MTKATAVHAAEERKERIVDLAMRINNLAELFQHAACCKGAPEFRMSGDGDHSEAVGGAIIDATKEIIRLARNGNGPGGVA